MLSFLNFFVCCLRVRLPCGLLFFFVFSVFFSFFFSVFFSFFFFFFFFIFFFFPSLVGSDVETDYLKQYEDFKQQSEKTHRQLQKHLETEKQGRHETDVALTRLERDLRMEQKSKRDFEAKGWFAVVLY